MEYIRTPKVENVRLVDNHSRSGVSGTLYLTATHLIFVDLERKKETWLLHSHIQTLEKLSISQNGSPLRIRCKTFQVLTFLISQERDCHDLYSSLMKLSKPVKMDELYAFSYNPRDAQLTQKEGWDLFSLNNDYLQMGLPTRYWKISRINNEFDLCETYPRLLCVPSLATPALMFGSAAFRSKRRLPAMSYLHTNGSVIVRCSQPMAGLNSRSIEDEAFVDLIRRSKSGNNDFLYIVDTRPMINAVANRAQGKGYENTDLYENIKYRFIGIDNIHVMRNSLSKMLEACEDSSCSMGSFLEAINSSGWLKHVHSVIQVSRFIANAVGVENRSVLVHCSDGWDRTAQTCALASIMLNPHYRTIDGFIALIQKEWLNFGHKFEHRCGHLDTDPKETSPVFTQFIDTVWQLMRLKPCSFQFNEQMLFDLHDHAYSCQFGTFLGNCPKVRQDNNLQTRTHSLWGWMMKRMDLYTNPMYRAVEQHRSENQLMLPPTTPHFVKLWTGMYNRFDAGLQPRESLASAVKALHGEATQLAKGVRDMKQLRNQYREALGMEIPDDTEFSVKEPSERTAKRVIASIEKPPSESPVLSRRPASTDNVVALAVEKKQPMLGLATHSSPDIARNNKKIASLSLNEIAGSSSVTVSFTANCMSDDDDERSSNADKQPEVGVLLPIGNDGANQTDMTASKPGVQNEDSVESSSSKSVSPDSWVSLHKEDFVASRPVVEAVAGDTTSH